mmetsp:Transcript_43171/g.107657  ORF Transcript_43171/g.107657 Transcript_43171/m.107657 type:complete len:125 (-) Transcript_43171:318-692(-)|eukprot:4916228-Prymnesium_polylepis.1
MSSSSQLTTSALEAKLAELQQSGKAPKQAGSACGSAVRSQGPLSQLSQAPERSQLGGSRVSASTQWQPPSTIRSSEPSVVQRNKLAEVELRLELEKIKRLEKEAELELHRRQALMSQGSGNPSK